MPQFRDYQVAGLLIVARKRLAYAKYITSYPLKAGKKNFDPSSQIDSFYKNVCNTSFHDSLLLTTSLIDKDPRIISFWNWPEFLAKRTSEIDSIKSTFESSGLKAVRDQVVGHADASNSNNRLPLGRINGVVDSNLIKTLDDIQIELIAEFYTYTKSIGQTYSPLYFDDSDAVEEISRIMDQARPQLTNNDVI